ncbi:metal-dependent hydrolase [Halopiger goleimassiliensis]|uniref:metal-dependent hydrolase n=1 Tax=Halopiger goleimassiliensis TaxID=1293048 RepID=UPI000677C0C2|nr:metal-dependent hydrolase [Halopiger goleimassiliensis]
MWPLGHVAVAYLCYTLATRHRFDASPGQLAAVAVVFGSQFPDLVDKPLAWYAAVLPTGRTLAHTLFVLVPLAIGLYALVSRSGRGEYAIAFAIGALSHSLVDAAPALWGERVAAEHLLWPLTPVTPYESGSPSILELLRGSASDPFFLAEFVLAALALALWRRDGYPGLGLLRTTLARLRPTPTDG